MIKTYFILLKIILIFNSFIKCYKKCIPQFLTSRIEDNRIGTYEIKSKALKKLYERKIIHYVSDIKSIDEILYKNENEEERKNRKSVYVGIDLNCKYLHLGNLIPLITLDILRNYNTDIIILLGSSTTKIGDPSFQNTKRKKTVDEEICENEKNIRTNIINLFLQNELSEKHLNEIIEKSNILSNKEFIYESKKKGSLIILKNNFWYDNINIIDFLKYGEYFSVNKLLRKECLSSKLKKNLTLKDLNYITLQSFDFLYLFQNFQTFIQIGGSDQWGNIQSGIELCQNIFKTQLYGFTTNLLLHKNNVKYSKSLFNENRKLPIWIDIHYNPPYLFWNFLRNIEDQKVQSYIDMLTDINIDINEKISNYSDSNYREKNENEKIDNTTINKNTINLEKIYEEEINKAKKKLSDSVTSYIYGKEVVKKIHKMNKMIKDEQTYEIENIEDLKIFPFLEISKDDLNEKKIDILQILKKFEIAETNKEAKEKINQKCIYLNKDLITNPKLQLSISNFLQIHNNYYAILRLGKKTFYSIIVK
ncbi:tyrosine--tRNA ligase, putative [Plasmodium gallinaceum]|uniref:Tyrosine--tRNA ligase n=1 Tax=Plasmodium gallinaceum TaxID=5849 RepID=A0A1J1GUN7_PLAGA|nr:tyrosine--tRNA ligase, putative [Plasmodium gallinaceum]CRG96223.1 tyrosine--tRNA ligase, putative [Plasmodium gallinaceum]